MSFSVNDSGPATMLDILNRASSASDSARSASCRRAFSSIAPNASVMERRRRTRGVSKWSGRSDLKATTAIGSPSAVMGKAARDALIEIDRWPDAKRLVAIRFSTSSCCLTHTAPTKPSPNGNCSSGSATPGARAEAKRFSSLDP